jgi:protein SCO1
MLGRFLIATAAAFVCLAIPAAAHDGDENHHSMPAGPADRYAFPLPEPGSYRLPPIKEAGGGEVLDEEGRPHDLRDLVRGRITVFSFIYTQCADICPVATMRLLQLHDLAARDPDLALQLRLVSMSFDPEHDTPEAMAQYGALWRSEPTSGPDWLFLTTAHEAALQPILSAYGQAVAPKPDPDDPAGPLSHILRVFLIDQAGMIRNIYSLDYLDPGLVLGDVRTLLLERKSCGDAPAPADACWLAGTPR